jgi:hypothetical protein
MNQQTNGKLQPPDDSWLTVDFFENRQNFPLDELMKYSGKHIAWSWDGTQIVASADDADGLYETVKSLGLSPSRVVHSYVDPGNEFSA